MIKPTHEFWKVFKETNGALSCAEAISLANIVNEAPEGMFLELGSHKGKSSQCIALGITSRHQPKSTLVLVEPEFKDGYWRNRVIATVSSMLPQNGFSYVADFSLNVIHEFDKLSFVFIDSGSHSDELVMNECKMLEDKIIEGGIICFHDFGSQFVKVNEAYDYLLLTGKYEVIKIDWTEILDYVKEHDLDNGNNSWHQYPDLPHSPNFIGAVKRVK